MSTESFVLKGDICHTPDKSTLSVHKNAYVVCREGKCEGIFDTLPEKYRGLEVTDFSGKLIIPGLVDLHTHAPQYAFCGTGMDFELLEWLEKQTFPEEIRYGDEAYARKAYGIFADKLRDSATTRAVIFATIHTQASLILMECMEETGLISYVGRVNMDRNAPPLLTEPDARQAVRETGRFIDQALARGFARTKPIITPRFVPSCSDELLSGLGALRAEYGLPVQSHLSENPGEVELVKELVPDSGFYGEVYDRYGLFGGEGKTVMAHCVYSTPDEISRMLENGVWAAHCPSSNMNLASGIAPVRHYLDLGIRVGLGTDMAAGTCESLFRAVTEAIQVSKLYWRYIDGSKRPLTFSESFYLATKGGGAFFGRAGSFEAGYEFDAVVIDDFVDPCPRELSVSDRVQRAFYLGLDRTGIVGKYARGERISLRDRK